MTVLVSASRTFQMFTHTVPARMRFAVRHDVGLVAEGRRGHDRAEDLLPHGLHVLAGAGEHGRRDEVAALAHAVAADDLGAVVPAGLDVAGHPVELFLRHQRAHGGLRVEPAAHLDHLGLLGDARDDLVVEEDRVCGCPPRP
jgi:hypothetical protein